MPHAQQRNLGVGIVGHGAGKLIAEGVIALETGANAKDLAACGIRIRRFPKR